jgi:hypothetical protein
MSLEAAGEHKPRRLATDETLAELLARHPGGTSLLEDVTADSVREFLHRDGRFDDFLGPPALRLFLSGDQVRERDLRPAAKLLERPVFWLEHLVFPALLEALTDGERQGMVDLVSQLSAQGFFVANRPLRLPGPALLGQAVRRYVDAHRSRWPDSVTTEALEVLNVLDPRRWRRRAVYTGSFTDLRELVLVTLAEASGAVLPAQLDTSPDRKARNWERFCALVGGTPERLDLKVCPELRKQLKVPYGVQPTTPRPPARRKARSRNLPSYHAVVEFLDEHVAHRGQLPAIEELSDGELVAIENITGRTYRSFTKALHEQHGARFPMPKRSANERELDRILHAAFDADIVADSFTVEWRDTHTFGKQSRIDTYFKLRPGALADTQDQAVEVFAEADGQGHFVPVTNFTPLKEYRRADRDKARALHRRWEASTEMVMVNIHHRLLSGPKAQRLTPDALSKAVKATYGANHWWVFLRPVDCDECRETPGGTTTVLDIGVAGVEALVLEDTRYTTGQLRLALP